MKNHIHPSGNVLSVPDLEGVPRVPWNPSLKDHLVPKEVILIWCSQILHAGRKACMFEIMSTTHLAYVYLETCAIIVICLSLNPPSKNPRSTTG